MEGYRTEPDNPEFLYPLSLYIFLNGDPQEAASLFEAARKVKPAGFDTLMEEYEALQQEEILRNFVKGLIGK
jgi:hypothetical protein